LEFIGQIKKADFGRDSDVKKLYEKASKIENQITTIAYNGNAAPINHLIDVTDKLKKAPEVNAFIGWNHKILAEDLHTCNVAEGCEYVADKMHDKTDREVVEILDRILTEYRAVRRKGDANEGPSVRYFCSKSSAYHYALVSDMGTLYLELRIRNVQKCLDYLGECPERIAEMFHYSDTGCQNRKNGTCRFGVKYVFEQEKNGTADAAVLLLGYIL